MDAAQCHGHPRDERGQGIDDHRMRFATRAFQALLRAVAEALENFFLVADDDGSQAARRQQFRVVILRCGHFAREPQIRAVHQRLVPRDDFDGYRIRVGFY